MKRLLIIFGTVFIGSALMCANVWGQATAQISGSVRDQSGAVLPGVEVMATQTDTGIIRSTVTNETGSYVLPNLPIGPYKIEAMLPGFRTYVQTGIVLEVNSSPAINVTLQVGQVSESIEVQANATLVETRNSGTCHASLRHHRPRRQRICLCHALGRGRQSAGRPVRWDFWRAAGAACQCALL